MVNMLVRSMRAASAARIRRVCIQYLTRAMKVVGTGTWSTDVPPLADGMGSADARQDWSAAVAESGLMVLGW
jgi:hypothetical protein